MSEKCSKHVHCSVKGQTQIPLNDADAPAIVRQNARVKIPVVLAERIVQIVVEANIELEDGAVEIKRVLKDVFLTQCKLVPVAFEDFNDTGYREVTQAKLFVEGYIRKNIEYATKDCHGHVRYRTANVPFYGFVDLTEDDFLTPPLFAAGSANRSQFINPKDGDLPRLDKFFFENTTFYNEQPYCELIRADFFELDFSPCPKHLGEEFKEIREKIVLDLTLKVLQVQQVNV
ncbi:CsxC family protein [Bacillus sp. TL12]|uniref:CsxC family protein n=1 Tax=Bacillus sp. TL12 TaxID=2894756 RepID=UPI001F51BC71|nr:Uracil permease [Bacillus sp. TL12]MCI0766132.1 Uracil permease [Bacillus sp. TL12]